MARLSGDEFAIVQMGVDSPADAAAFANRINQVLLDPFMIDGREVSSSASIGITLYPRDGRSPEDLLQNADLAMYRVKANGRNGFAFFAGEMLSQAREGLAVVLAEQNAYWALGLANRGVIIELGRSSTEGNAAELLEDSRIRSAYLGI